MPNVFGWVAVVKIVLGVAIGSTIGTYMSIQVARKILEGKALSWFQDSGVMADIDTKITNEYAHAVGRAMASELQKVEDER